MKDMKTRPVPRKTKLSHRMAGEPGITLSVFRGKKGLKFTSSRWKNRPIKGQFMKDGVLVTGASGFIGPRLVRELKERGLFIHAVVREHAR